MVITIDDVIQQIDVHTKIVSLANMNNLVGIKFDTKQLVDRIRQINASCIIIIDATQYLMHQDLDVGALDVDFVLGSGHKLFGPNGIGFCYYSARFAHSLTDPKWRRWILMPQNYCVNSDCVDGDAIIGLGKSLHFLNQNLVPIQRQDRLLNQYFVHKWHQSQLTNFVCYNIDHANGIFLLGHKTIPVQEVCEYLDRHKIIVRAGWSCAVLARHILGNSANFFRVSLSFLNRVTEIDRFFVVLEQFDPQKDLLTFL